MINHKPSLGLMVTQNLGPIGSAVLTFIGHKQTDKPNLYIERREGRGGCSVQFGCP